MRGILAAVSAHRVVGVTAVLVLALPVAGCGLFGAEPKPEDSAKTFLSAFAGGDTTTAANSTDEPKPAKELLDRVRAALKPTAVSTTVQQTLVAADDSTTASASYDVKWDLGAGRTWAYQGKLELRRTEKTWRVHWAPNVIHPKLQPQQTLALREQQPQLAPILDRDGGALLNPEKVVVVLLDRKSAGDLPKTAGALAAAVSRFDKSITQQSVTDGASKVPDGQAYTVVSLRDADYQQVKGAIYDLPGVRFSSQSRLLAPAGKEFASQVLPGVRKTVEDQVAGTAGWRVVTLNAGGSEVEALQEQQAQPAKAVTLTLSRGVQAAAEDALEPIKNQAMLVAFQPSTGDVLAVAQNAEADKGGSLALTGNYPPGSTFKVVTAAAALQAGAATPDTVLPCPGTWTLQGRKIPNNDEFDLGNVPLHQAFAASCNTTFAELASKLPADSLTNAAKQFGVGVDFDLAGVRTLTGKVPPAEPVVERAEDGFGQGKVVTTPFGMALVAATAARGSMPTPNLLRGTETKVVGGIPAPAPAIGDQIRPMMREVVVSGTAKKLNRLGEVHGKTGTAQFGDGTHSHGWFIGFRGDLAFAVLIVDAGTSGPAVDAAARFLGAVR
ncbi:penicillin-binding transpeptidase domain-containing protein [Crossiella cryophila]